MAIMPDTWIKQMAEQSGMIKPFVSEQNKNGVISYGLSSYGYDARVANEFKVFTNVNNAMVDPKNFSDESFIQRNDDSCIIPPNSFVLALFSRCPFPDEEMYSSQVRVAGSSYFDEPIS